MKETTFIYALECPIFSEIRYIGQSSNPQLRYSNHKRSNVLYIKNWFSKLKEFGTKPNLIILEEVEVKFANLTEDYYIEKYASVGYLFNKVLNRNLAKAKLKPNETKKHKGKHKEIVEYKKKVTPFLNLTRTETIVMNMLIDLTSYSDICEKLFIAKSTLKTHLSGIRIKLGLADGSNTKDWVFELIRLYSDKAKD